jgi:hypothetical protein
MTLNMVVATPWGLWLSTDFRVTDRTHGISKPRKDHWSPKYFEAKTPLEERLAITYTGIAEMVAVEPSFGIPDSDIPGVNKAPGKKRRVPVSEWISWVLHGQSRSLDEIVHHIASEAAKAREFRVSPHIFTGIAIFPTNGACFFQIANLDIREGDYRNGALNPACFERRPQSKFEVMGRKIQTSDQVVGGALGLGAASISDSDKALLRRVAKSRPKDYKDYMNVLAAINGRVAARDRFKSVSPACQVIHLDPSRPQTSNGSHSRLYENGQKIPKDFDLLTVRANLSGFDVTSLTRAAFMGVKKERDDRYERKAQEYMQYWPLTKG